MSTRYVWKASHIDAQMQEVTKTGYTYPETWYTDSYTVIGYIADKTPDTVYDEFGIPKGFNLKGTITSLRHIDGAPHVAFTVFFAFRRTENIQAFVTANYTKGGYWHVNPGGQAPSVYVSTKEYEGTNIPIKVTSFEYKGGAFINNVSSSVSNAYPTDSGGARKEEFWYTYRGSDNIDPKSISYPTENLEAEKQITVSVSPSNSNQYGGTITYLYQYSRNNGSWTDLKTTTATSATYTIPEGTANIRFRVQASDNMGFTSKDYVTGPAAAVSQLKAYVGISGRARKVDKLYIGVNGKARQVIKGYIGVNGKARKFL